MCRWIAYRGETTSFEPYVTEPEHSLIAQSIRSLQSTAGSNGDGFGLGLDRARIRKGENCSVRACDFRRGRGGTGISQTDYRPQVVPLPGGP
ncbi:hypothetical protein ABIA96_002244 [Bradyrhizobium sp. LB11.1]|jgi:hypothetical protein